MTTMVDPVWVQQVFQGFADDAAPATATAISVVTNTSFTQRASTSWQLRVRIAQTAATANQNNVVAFKLKHQVNGTGGFTDVPAQGASGTKVRMFASSNFADGDAIATGSFRLGTGTGTAVAGECEEVGTTGTITFPIAGSASYTELVFALEWGTAIAHLDEVEFRVYLSTDVALNTYTVTPTVRYNGTGSAIEATSSIIPAGGGDYTTVSAWESGTQRDLLATDEIEAAECSSGAIDNVVSFAGWTTDAAHYIHVRPAAGSEHGGDPAAGFRMEPTGTGPVITLTASPAPHHIRISGIVIKNAGTTTAGITYAAGSVAKIDGNIIYTTTSSGDGITCQSTSQLYAWNNIIFGFGEGIVLSTGTDVAFIYNNTIVGTTTNGIRRSAGTVTPKNNVLQAASGDCFNGTMTDAATNISSDATGQIQATLTFADAANDDYHLAAGDTAAIGAGTDLHADASLPFNTDIDGDTRPDGDWDIGADQTVAAAANELSGTPSAQPADASGTMAAVASASGAPSATTATADGAMQHVSSVAGAPQAAPATPDGTLQALIQLGGAPTAEPATSAGTLEALASMAGAAAAERAASAGAVGVVVSMSGAVQAGAAEVLGGLMDDGAGPPSGGFFGSDEWWI